MDYIARNHKALLEFMFLCEAKFQTYAIPFLTNHDYDVIGINDSACFKIKIICTENKQPSGAYVANLLRSGGYERGKEMKIHFDNKSCDYIFIWTPEEKYLIPSLEITQTRAITLSMFQNFRIF